MGRNTRGTYLALCMLALKPVVEQTAINYVDERMTFDVSRKGKIAVRFLDVPLFLEFGGRLTIVCAKRLKIVVSGLG